MSTIQGVVIGLVKDLDDPDGLGRIRVLFPWLSDEELSGWASIASPMAGKSRGYWYMPEVDDEVLIAFEHGDFDHPFVVGFLHNGVDVPPSDGIDVSVRRIRTVSGHVLEFDDRDGKERVTLKSQGGQTLELTDSPKQIELSTTTGTKITLTDAPSEIKLATVAGVTVTINDTGGVTVSAPTGALTVNSLNATVNATASCSVNASTLTLNGATVSVNSGIAMFSGVVQCSALITNSVVSTSYTPGAGNIW